MQLTFAAALEGRWREELQRSLATYLGISAWRVLIGYVRGSVQVAVRIIDADGIGSAPTAAGSVEYLQQQWLDASDRTLTIGAYTLTAVSGVAPSPLPPSPRPPAPPPPPPEQPTSRLRCT